MNKQLGSSLPFISFSLRFYLNRLLLTTKIELFKATNASSCAIIFIENNSFEFRKQYETKVSESNGKNLHNSKPIQKQAKGDYY